MIHINISIPDLQLPYPYKSSTTKVYDIKNYIFDKYKIPTKYQKLKHKSRIMENDKLLSDYQINFKDHKGCKCIKIENIQLVVTDYVNDE